MASALFDTEKTIDLPDRSSRRFFAQELANLLLCSVLPILCISILLLSIMAKSVVNNSCRTAETHVSHIAEQMDVIVAELDSLNVTFSANTEILSALTRSLILNKGSYMNTLRSISSNYLIPAVAARSYIHSMYLYIENDRHLFLTSTVGVSSLDQYFDVSWYSAFLQHRGEKYQSYSQLRSLKQYDFEKETDIITLYRPLLFQDGVVVMNLRQDYFNAQLSRSVLSPSELILVCDSDGSILMSSRRSQLPGSDELQKICQCDVSELTSYNLDGTKYHIVRTQSSRTPWTYLSLRTRDDLYSPFHSLLLIVASSTLLMILLSIVLSIRHARRSVDSLRQVIVLLESARRHEELPASQSYAGSDIYSHILQRILYNFARQNQLYYQLQQKKNAVKELELTALRAQINPHFLFNTLKTICWMSIEQTGQPNAVSQMIEDMSEILEYSMDSRQDIVPLAQELHNAESYLHIQSQRYKSRFEARFVYDHEITSYYVPKLLIQPLLENSINHGIRWSQNEVLHIVVNIFKIEEEIRIQVIDDGVGIPPQELENIRNRLNNQSDEGHIGLFSCNRRLRLTYGDPYGLSIESSDGRTCVTLRMPIIRHAGDEEKL